MEHLKVLKLNTGEPGWSGSSSAAAPAQRSADATRAGAEDGRSAAGPGCVEPNATPVVPAGVARGHGALRRTCTANVAASLRLLLAPRAVPEQNGARACAGRRARARAQEAGGARNRPYHSRGVAAAGEGAWTRARRGRARGRSRLGNGKAGGAARHTFRTHQKTGWRWCEGGAGCNGCYRYRCTAIPCCICSFAGAAGWKKRTRPQRQNCTELLYSLQE